MQGIRKACSLTKKNGHIIIGLYNHFGRKPFLDYFQSLKNKNFSEEELFCEYKKLDDRYHADETMARSWFNDQVLHPHETQHTITEVLEVFKECGIKFHSTSINGYEDNSEPDLDALLIKEKQLHDAGVRAIEQGRYYPGYFLTVGERI
jgi:hypothetical protein